LNCTARPHQNIELTTNRKEGFYDHFMINYKERSIIKTKTKINKKCTDRIKKHQIPNKDAKIVTDQPFFYQFFGFR